MKFKKIAISGLIMLTSTCFAGVSIANVEKLNKDTFHPVFGEIYEIDTAKSKGIFKTEQHKPIIVIGESKGVYNISGKSGCNGFSATLEKNGEKMHAINAVSTRKMCHGNSMIIENEFMKTIRADSEWTTVNNEIHIKNENTQLIFKLK